MTIESVFELLAPYSYFDPVNFRDALTKTNELINLSVSYWSISTAEMLQREILNHIQAIQHSMMIDHNLGVFIRMLQKELHQVVVGLRNYRGGRPLEPILFRGNDKPTNFDFY